MNSSTAGVILFPTTQWSLVLQGRAALGHIYEQYREALKLFLLRSRRMRPEAADDLLQQFFADKMIEEDLLARVDSRKGMFRTFLLQVLKRFHLNALRHDRAARRHPAAGVIEFDAALDHCDKDRDADLFDVQWAREALASAVVLTKAHCEAAQRADIWGVLEARVLGPALRGEQRVPYDELVVRFGLDSVSHACNIMITGKRILERAVRQVISQYASDEADVDAEIHSLFQILRQADAES